MSLTAKKTPDVRRQAPAETPNAGRQMPAPRKPSRWRLAPHVWRLPSRLASVLRFVVLLAALAGGAVWAGRSLQSAVVRQWRQRWASLGSGPTQPEFVPTTR